MKINVEKLASNPFTPDGAANDSLFDEFFKQTRHSSGDHGGYRNFLATDSLSVIGSRQRRAREMRTEGENLAHWVSSITTYNPDIGKTEDTK